MEKENEKFTENLENQVNEDIDLEIPEVNLPDYVLDGGHLVFIPVVIVALKCKTCTPFPIYEGVGAGADGLGGKIVAAFKQVGGKNVVEVIGKIVKQVGIRLGGGDLYLVLADGLNVGYHAGVGSAGGHGLGILYAGYHVAGVKLLAVMEHYAFMQLEDVFGVAGLLIAFAKVWDHVEGLGIGLEEQVVGKKVHVYRCQ